MRRRTTVTLGLLLAALYTGRALADQPTSPPTPVGNGVVVSTDGHILTLASLVGQAKKTAVLLRGRPSEATVVAVDAGLDLAILKVAGAGLARATLCDSGRSLGRRDLSILGAPVRHGWPGPKRRGIHFAQDDAALLPHYGPARKGARPNVLMLSGPVNPGLAGAGLFDTHGDLVAIVNPGLAKHPRDLGRAIDIRAAIPLLKKNNVSFAVGGAPMQHSLDDLFSQARHAVVTFARPDRRQGKPNLILPLPGPTVQFTRTLSFLGTAGAYSPDGKRIAVARWLGSGASTRSEILLLDAETGETLATLTGQVGSVGTLAFSPDGKRLMSIVPPLGFGKWNKPTVLWNVQNGAKWNQLPQARDGAFSPDGKLIALRVGGQDKSWRLGKPKPNKDVETLILDAATGKKIAAIVPGRYGLCGELYQFHFLPKSGKILTAGLWWNIPRRRFEILHVWDPRTGRLLRKLTVKPAIDWPKHGYIHGSVAVSPDERTLVLRRYREKAKLQLAEVIDLATMNRRYAIADGPTDFMGHLKWPQVVISPASDLLVMPDSGVGFVDGQVRIYDLASGTYFGLLEGGTRAQPVLSPDGRRLVQIYTGGVISWNLPQPPTSAGQAKGGKR